MRERYLFRTLQSYYNVNFHRPPMSWVENIAVHQQPPETPAEIAFSSISDDPIGLTVRHAEYV
jgi:hypothetical protein